MLNKEDIEVFLDRLGAEETSYKEVEPGLWVVKPGGALDFNVVVHFSPPVVVLRVRVMEPPAGGERRADLYRRLLELNARELVHGSYGLEGDHVVLTDTLELENLDFNEFQASYDSIMIALATHVGALAQYRER